MGFSIQFDANTAQIARSMSELKSDLVSFKGALEKATDTQTISRLNKSIKETDAALKAIKNTSFDIGPKIAAGAGQATSALTNFGRVVQDAPFGIIGIANNIDPLIQSFIYLKRETGSASAAFKALGSSLLGGGGIALAVSLITSAMVLFAQSSHGAKKELEGFDKAIDEANKRAGEQLARLQILNAVIIDNSRSTKERSSAAGELSTMLKGLNIELSKEKILNGEVATAVDLATAAILKRAQATAVESRLAELSGQQLNRDIKRINVVNDLAKAEQNLTDQEKIRQQVVGGGAVPGISGNVITANAAVNTLKKSLSDLDKQTEEANKEIALLLSKVSAEDLNIKLDTGNTKKEVDLLKQRIAALKEIQSLVGLDFQQRGELTSLEIELAKRDDVVKLGFTKEELKEKVEFLINKYVPSVEITPSIVAKPKAITEGVQFDIAKAIGLSDTITPPAMTIAPPASVNADPFADAIADAFTESLTVVGESIGKAFATGDFMGGLREAAQGILSILGDTLIGIGKQLIVTSALVKLLKSALRGLFGPGGEAAALAVGVGLIAFGGLLKNIDFQGPKLADGGIVSGSTIANIGEAGTEVVAPLTKLPYLMNQAGGGSGGMVVGLRVKGRELLAMLERERSFAKRLG